MLISEPILSELLEELQGKQLAIVHLPCDVFHQMKDASQRLSTSSGVKLNVFFPSSQGNVLCSHSG